MIENARDGTRGHQTLPAEFASSPLIATEEVPCCAVCGGASFTPFAQGYDYELRTCRNLWTFVRCAACSHVWLNPRPALSTLGVIYPPHYYAYDYESRISALARWGKSVLDGRKLAAILSRAGHTPQSYLDIGCGSGRYLRAMEARGLEKRNIHGLELDENVVKHLVADGFNVKRARVEDAEISPGSIDLITMFHVLEHVDAPDRVIQKVAGWLSPKGVLAIETPNVDALDQRMFADSLWGGYHIPRHWHLFTPATLTRLLTTAGLTPVATLFQTGHSFWMYSVHHWLRYSGTPQPRLAQFFDPFSNVAPLAAFTLFDKARAAVGAQTSAMLMLARRASV